MRVKILSAALVLGLCSLFAVTRAAAQLSGRTLVVNIPFKFTICHEQLPAGKYIVHPVSSANPRLMLVRSDDGRAVATACTLSVQGSKAAPVGKLIFNRYGEHYFLAQVWLQGDLQGSQFPQSDREKALAKGLAASKKKRERVTVRVIEEEPPK